jgi:EmrB/QacA subfamily drug resistance transporter
MSSLHGDMAGVMSERRRWILLWVLCLGQLMVILDQTVVNVALPSIQRELHFTPSALAWIINAYLITFGGLLLLAGRVGDLIGQKKVFITGLALFTVTSAWCGLSGSQTELICARFVQGIGAAAVAATILGILVTLFPDPREKTMAMGIYVFVSSTGAITGLLIGGALTQTLGWHWVFFINLPIGGIAFVAGSILIAGRRGTGLRTGVDVAGGVLVTSATMLLSYAIIEASANGWGSTRTIGGAGIALALLIIFIWLERRVKSPMVPLRIFRSRNIRGATVVRALFPVAGVGIPYLGSLYVQHVLDYSPLKTGVAFLPMTCTSAVCTLVVTPRLVHRMGNKATLVPGLVLIGAGLFLFARTPVDDRYVAYLLPAMIVAGIGFALASTPMIALTMAGIASSDTGLASGLSNAAGQLGGGLGVAVLASVSTARSNRLLAEGSRRAGALVGGYHAAFLTAAGCLLAAAVVATLVIRERKVDPSGL